MPGTTQPALPWRRFIIVAPESRDKLQWTQAEASAPESVDMQHIQACFEFAKGLPNVQFNWQKVLYAGESCSPNATFLQPVCSHTRPWASAVHHRPISAPGSRQFRENSFTIMAAGYSRGGYVAASLASRTDYVTHALVLHSSVIPNQVLHPCIVTCNSPKSVQCLSGHNAACGDVFLQGKLKLDYCFLVFSWEATGYRYTLAWASGTPCSR